MNESQGLPTRNIVLDTPWRIRNELLRYAVQPIIRSAFWLGNISYGRGWRIFGLPIIQRHRGSRIELGDYLELRSWPGSNPLAPNHPVVLATRTPDAVIRIGHHCGFTGTTIVAAETITIGDRVLVGSNSTIVDTDFHPLTRAEREYDILAGAHTPVVIEDDVFIGLNCLILKGVRIGHDSVIAAGSVVTSDVPPGVIAAGNPARVVKEL